MRRRTPSLSTTRRTQPRQTQVGFGIDPLTTRIEKYITANAASNTPPNIKIKVVTIVQFPSVAANHGRLIVVALNPRVAVRLF